MTKQNSWLLTKKEAEEILQNILDNKSIYLFKQNDNFYYAYRNKRIFLYIYQLFSKRLLHSSLFSNKNSFSFCFGIIRV